MPKIGFIQDFRLAARPGGAQEVAEEILRRSPSATSTVVYCPPGQVKGATCDGYLVGNFLRYTPEEMEEVLSKPFAVYVFGWWADSHPLQDRYRQRLIEEAGLVVWDSPFHKDYFLKLWPLEPKGRVEVVPCPMDYRGLLEVNPPPLDVRPTDCLWWGELHPFQGFDVSCRWAENNERHLNLFGIGQFPAPTQFVHPQGTFASDQRTRILYDHRCFPYFPRRPSGFSLAMLEAYLAGLELVYSGRIGIFSFKKPLEAVAEDCCQAGERLWQLVEGALS